MKRIFLLKWSGKVAVVVCRDRDDIDEGRLGEDCEVWEIGMAHQETPPCPLVVTGDPTALTGIRPLGIPVNDAANAWKPTLFATR